MSITKFKNDVGYSLCTNGEEEAGEVRSKSREKGRQASRNNSPQGDLPPAEYLMAKSLTPRDEESPSKKHQGGSVLPEFKLVREVAEIYSCFTQANIKHRVLMKR